MTASQRDNGAEQTANELLQLLVEIQLALEQHSVAHVVGPELVESRWFERYQVATDARFFKFLGHLAGASDDTNSLRFQQRLYATVNSTAFKCVGADAYVTPEALINVPLAEQPEFHFPYYFLGFLRSQINAALTLGSASDSPPTEANEDGSGGTDTATEPPTPKCYLHGWDQILDALELKDAKEERRRVGAVNKSHEGPIIMPGRGGKVRTERGKLIEWWNSLEDRWREIQQKKLDTDATVSETYQHGRNGEVVPGIDGEVKRRKS